MTATSQLNQHDMTKTLNAIILIYTLMTCSNLTIETVEKGIKWFKVNNKNTTLTSNDTSMIAVLMQCTFCVDLEWPSHLFV